MNASLIFVMVAVAIGGVAWVFIYPLLSGERNAERRMASVARKEPMQQRAPRSGQKSRREQVEGTLKQLEARQKASKRIPLSMRLVASGTELDAAPLHRDLRLARLRCLFRADATASGFCRRSASRSPLAVGFPSGHCHS